MGPHPILMDTLHHDRQRKLEDALKWRHVDQFDEASAEPASRQPLVVRVLARLSLIGELPKGKARDAPAR